MQSWDLPLCYCEVSKRKHVQLRYILLMVNDLDNKKIFFLFFHKTLSHTN